MAEVAMSIVAAKSGLFACFKGVFFVKDTQSYFLSMNNMQLSTTLAILFRFIIF